MVAREKPLLEAIKPWRRWGWMKEWFRQLLACLQCAAAVPCEKAVKKGEVEEDEASKGKREDVGALLQYDGSIC